MTDREKQIEEIVELLKNGDDFCVDVGGRYCDTCSPNRHERCTVWKQAKLLYNAGYRKMDEVTLRLDLGDRSAEEIKQIAEAFNGEIKKQVAKEILQFLHYEIDREKSAGTLCDDFNYGLDTALNKIENLSEKYGVEIEK